MKKVSNLVRVVAAALLTGGVALQFGGCTTDDFKTQASRGVVTALDGLFEGFITDIANDVFDVGG